MQQYRPVLTRTARQNSVFKAPGAGPSAGRTDAAAVGEAASVAGNALSLPHARNAVLPLLYARGSIIVTSRDNGDTDSYWLAVVCTPVQAFGELVDADDFSVVDVARAVAVDADERRAQRRQLQQVSLHWLEPVARLPARAAAHAATAGAAAVAAAADDMALSAVAVATTT